MQCVGGQLQQFTIQHFALYQVPVTIGLTNTAWNKKFASVKGIKSRLMEFECSTLSTGPRPSVFYLYEVTLPLRAKYNLLSFYFLFSVLTGLERKPLSETVTYKMLIGYWFHNNLKTAVSTIAV